MPFVSSLTSCPLTLVHLEGAVFPEAATALFPEVIRKNPLLTDLDLGIAQFHPHHWLALSAACEENQTLERLSLRRGGPLHPHFDLVEGLLRSPALRCLELYRGGMQRRSFSQKDLAVLRVWLATNPPLLSLGISVSTGCLALQQFLESLCDNNKQLTSLTILAVSSELGAVVGVVTKWLGSNVTVSNLKVSFKHHGNNAREIEDAAQMKFFATACGQSRLQQLSVARSSTRPLVLGDESVRELADALKTNSCLTSLTLRKQLLTDIGLGHLAEALRTNQVLKILDLGDNLFRGGSAQKLVDALQSNVTLTGLSLTNEASSDPFLCAWAEPSQAIVRRNAYPSIVLQMADESAQDPGQVKRRRLNGKQASRAHALVFRRLSGASVVLNVSLSCRLQQMYKLLEERVKPIGRVKVLLPNGQLLHMLDGTMTVRELLESEMLAKKAAC